MVATERKLKNIETFPLTNFQPIFKFDSDLYCEKKGNFYFERIQRGEKMNHFLKQKFEVMRSLQSFQKLSFIWDFFKNEIARRRKRISDSSSRLTKRQRLAFLASLQTRLFFYDCIIHIWLDSPGLFINQNSKTGRNKTDLLKLHKEIKTLAWKLLKWP